MQDRQLGLVGLEGEEIEPPEGAVERGVDEAGDLEVVDAEVPNQPAALLLNSGPTALPDSPLADQEGSPAVVASLSLGEAVDSQGSQVGLLEVLGEEVAGVHGSQDSTAESDVEGDQIHVPE